MSDSFPGVSLLQLLSGDWPGKGAGEIRSQAKQCMELGLCWLLLFCMQKGVMGTPTSTAGGRLSPISIALSTTRVDSQTPT